MLTKPQLSIFRSLIFLIFRLTSLRVRAGAAPLLFVLQERLSSLGYNLQTCRQQRCFSEGITSLMFFGMDRGHHPSPSLPHPPLKFRRSPHAFLRCADPRYHFSLSAREGLAPSNAVSASRRRGISSTLIRGPGLPRAGRSLSHSVNSSPKSLANCSSGSGSRSVRVQHRKATYSERLFAFGSA